MNQLDDQAKLLLKWQKNPDLFFQAAWPDVFLWDKLRDVLKALVNNRRIAVPSGHGVGKTWLEARIALWFLYCFPPSKVITTAPTWPQVEMLLWSEIKNAYRTSQIPMGGRSLSTELKVREDWFAIGFSTSGKADEREFGTPKFQGFHAENLLVLLDEAPGVKPEIWVSVESLIVADNNKVLAMGNPTSPTGNFYDACKSPLWVKVNISSFDHPNVKEDKIIVAGAVTKQWIDERRKAWGEDSPLWIAKVLGEFPAEGTDTLIPLAWAEDCVGLDLSERDADGNIIGDNKLGVDVARYGGDMTVLTDIVGKMVGQQEAENKKDTNWTIGRVKVKNKSQQYDAIGVDDTGVGGGVTDGLEDDGIDVDAMNFGSNAIDSDTFENLKAEIYWNLREDIKATYEAIRDGKPENRKISLPDDKELISQICSIKYKYTRKGKIAIESKDDMKKRGQKSPDKADSLAIGWSAGRIREIPRITVIGDEEDEDED